MGNNIFKTLIFSSLYPLPENIGTRMRTMNFIRFFKKLGEVDLVYFRAGHENCSGEGPFRKEFRIEKRDVSEENENFPRYRDFKDRLRRLAEQRPWIVSDWPKRAIEELNAVVAGDHYDFVLCRYMQASQPFLRFRGSLRKRVIIDFDDVLSTSLFEAYVKRAPGIYGGLKWHLQRRMLLKYQKRCLTLGAALFCSDEDRKEVTGQAGSANAHLVPNTYPIGARIRKPDGSGYVNRPTLLFVGALDYNPNIAGLKWFLNGIFPKVKERYHDVRLLVVGRRPPEDLVRICREHPGVELHPDVTDVGPYYEKCGAVVVPLLSGGGTRIKILEAAMAGRPVLSTPLGAEGLGCVDGVHLMLFTDDGSFMERFNSLDEEETYRGYVGRLHAFVEERYSPAAFDRMMEDVVERLLRETKGRV
jgi:Glycosyltransferase